MKRFTLKDRHVLITGAAGGIGTALSRRLLREGVGRLILVDRDLEGLQTLKQDLEKAPDDGCDITSYEVDLESRESMTGLVQGLRDQRLDVLINNAGVAPGETFHKMDYGAIESVIDTNLKAAVFLTYHLLPNLLESDGACIVNVASGSGVLAPGGMAAYAASKFGMVGFSEALRAELRGDRVGVSVVCPPFVRTNIIRNSFSGTGDLPIDEADRIERLDRLVQKKGLSPEKVAGTIIRVIKHDRGRVVIGVIPRILIALRFFFPGMTDRLNHLNFRKMMREGILR